MFSKLSSEKTKAGISDGSHNRKSTKDQSFTNCLVRNEFVWVKSHFDYFPENMCDLREEQGERSHKKIRPMEERY